MDKGTFTSIDFGTKVTTAKIETIDVTIDPSIMINDYARAYVNELHRRNPVRLESVGLTEEDLQTYFCGLIAMRIDSIHDQLKDWRKAKALCIPAWIEFVMTCVGEVVDPDRGLRILPSCQMSYDMDDMLKISDELSSFKSDGLVLLVDAFPRTNSGDEDLMMMAIINDYVYSMSKEAHPIYSYVAAYLGMKIKEETAFKMLYRIRYDDIDYIRTMLLREGKLY